MKSFGKWPVLGKITAGIAAASVLTIGAYVVDRKFIKKQPLFPIFPKKDERTGLIYTKCPPNSKCAQRLLAYVKKHKYYSGADLEITKADYDKIKTDNA